MSNRNQISLEQINREEIKVRAAPKVKILKMIHWILRIKPKSLSLCDRSQMKRRKALIILKKESRSWKKTLRKDLINIRQNLQTRPLRVKEKMGNIKTHKNLEELFQ
jgi:hypothetical protein